VIFLIHLLEHLGVPSGAAIAIVIAGRKALKAGTSRMGRRAPVTATGGLPAATGERRRTSPIPAADGRAASL
jgi:hypothetical protein